MTRALTIAFAAGLLCCGLVGCEEEPPPPPAGVNTEERPVAADQPKVPGSEPAEVLKGGGDSGGVR
ncbi:MAG: hypothetical protein ACYTGG_01745 [Planctomycetota bacterium]|jgi:hypothetical protein